MGLSQRGLVDSTIGRALKQKMDLNKNINASQLEEWIKRGTIPAAEAFMTNHELVLEDSSKNPAVILQVEYNDNLFYHKSGESDENNRVYGTCIPVEFAKLKTNVLSPREFLELKDQ